LFSVSVILVLMIGCGAPADTGQPLAIHSFGASPESIATGESSTLSWSVSGATVVFIDQGVGNVGLTGTRTVSPSTATSYALTAANKFGSITAVAQVVITEEAAITPIIDSFAAAPDSIAHGETSKLTWNVSEKAEVVIVPVVGNVGQTGSKSVSPEATTIYTLTATNESGSVTATTQVRVTMPSQRTITLFSIGAEDGHVIENGVIHPHPHAGDTDENRAMQAFLSFDISEIPAGSDIKSASLDVSGGDEIGEPFMGLGVMRVYIHQYSALDSNDFTSGFPGGEICRYYSCPKGASHSSELVSALQNGVDIGASRLQIRLQFQMHTNGNYREDVLRIRQPKLVVTYEG